MARLIRTTLARTRRLLERRITASTYLAALALMALVATTFAVVYRESFQAFLGQQQNLHKEQVRALAGQLEPGLKLMGVHTPLLTLLPSEAKLVNYDVMLERPPLRQLASELEQVKDGRPGRMDSFGVVRVNSASGEYIYVIARLANTVLQPRQLGSRLLVFSDYFVVRYETTEAVQHRLVAYESLKQPTAPQIAEAAGYIANEDLFPRVQGEARDRQIKGGAYLEDGQLYLLLRLQLSGTNENSADALSPKHRLTIAWGSSSPSLLLRYSLNDEQAAAGLCALAGRMHPINVTEGIQSLRLLVGRKATACAIPIASRLLREPAENLPSWFERFHVWLARRIARTTVLQSDDELISQGALRADANLNVGTGIPVQLEATQSLTSMIAAWRDNSRAQLMSFIIPMVGIAALTLIFHLTVLRRIQRLSESARIRKGGDFATPELKQRDEIGVLAKRFAGLLRARQNESADLERVARELRVQNDRLSAANKQLSETASHIRHNVRLPLERLRSYMKDDVRVSLFEAVLRATDEIVKDQTIASDTQRVALHVYMRSWCANLTEEIPDINLQFKAPAGEVWARADENGLEDTLDHILSNARDFRTPGTPLTLSVETNERHAIIHFHNCGELIPEELRDKIFEQHWTSRASSTGHMGLGLYEARRFMVAMGGDLTASNDATGVDFQIFLLLAQPAVQNSAPA